MSTANLYKFRIFLRPGVQQMSKRRKTVCGGGVCRPRGELLVPGNYEKEDSSIDHVLDVAHEDHGDLGAGSAALRVEDRLRAAHRAADNAGRIRPCER